MNRGRPKLGTRYRSCPLGFHQGSGGSLISDRPDMTSAVDWVLDVKNQLSIAYLSLFSVSAVAYWWEGVGFYPVLCMSDLMHEWFGQAAWVWCGPQPTLAQVTHGQRCVHILKCCFRFRFKTRFLCGFDVCKTCRSLCKTCCWLCRSCRSLCKTCCSLCKTCCSLCKTYWFIADYCAKCAVDCAKLAVDCA